MFIIVHGIFLYRRLNRVGQLSYQSRRIVYRFKPSTYITFFKKINVYVIKFVVRYQIARAINF